MLFMKVLRMKVKQDNFETERLLTDYAEPMAVFAALCGAVYPQEFVDKAYNYMLQNHGHDSIGACGRDVVYKDVEYRFRQSREIATCVLERALMDLSGDIDFAGWDKNDMALVMFNPAPFKSGSVTALRLSMLKVMYARTRTYRQLILCIKLFRIWQTRSMFFLCQDIQ